MGDARDQTVAAENVGRTIDELRQERLHRIPNHVSLHTCIVFIARTAHVSIDRSEESSVRLYSL